jgi:predicted ATP-grasp superfamily ATP-dependent carboligase
MQPIASDEHENITSMKSSSINNSTPVLVLKLEHYGSLGIVRSLGRLGVPVYGLDASSNAPAAASRFCQGFFQWDIDRQPGRATVEYLLDLGGFGRPPLLIPTSDETTMFVAEHSDQLRRRFVFPLQNDLLVHSLCSKKAMFHLAQQHEVPTAATFFPRNRHDVEESLDRLSFPLMLKGIDGGRLEQRTGLKMLIVQNESELFDAYESMEDSSSPNLMLQEYIPGGDDTVWMFNGYFDRDSDCLLGFTGKKIRQNPVYTGMTSLGICLWNEDVANTTTRFMKRIGYRGILDIGYRYDARDGLYKVLDVNPRIGATFRLFVGTNGMDVARALYLDMTGQPVPRSFAPEGRKWLVEDKDLLSSYRYFRDGRLNPLQWLSSLRGVRETGYFAWEDLRPFYRMGMNHVEKKWLSFTESRRPWITTSKPPSALQSGESFIIHKPQTHT